MFSIDTKSSWILIMFILVWDYSESQLSFQQEERSSELSILCRYADEASPVISHLVISRIKAGRRHIQASVSADCNQNSPLSRVSDAKVTGHLSYNEPTSRYIRIVWTDLQLDLDGDYTCEAYGVDADLIPQTFIQHLNVKSRQNGLRLVATPDVIKVGLTKQLQICCTLPDHGVLNITRMASLEIFKQQNGVKCRFARIKMESGEAILSGAVKTSLNGTMDDNQTSLELIWGNITAADAGDFTCEGSGVNAKGHPVFFNKYINVTWANPDREELTNLLFDLYDKESESLRLQEEKKKKLRATTKIIDSLKSTECRKPNSCDTSIFESGQRIVSLEPDDGLGPITVVCEGKEPGEMWTVIQKRFNGSVDFYRNFSQYENGFGSLDGEFWLGLKNIRRLLLQNEDKNRLRIEITEMTSGNNFTKNYHRFSLGPANGYKLNVIGFDDLGYGMSFNSGYSFSTPDSGVPRLAVLNRAGWWFNYESPFVNLNGVWGVKGKRYSIYWSEFRRDRNVILEKTEMKFRRNFNK
uniref:Fibrinogen C-terminal domain-containing protein n=1 Tax=Arion vulgaris TaxID=1028688 RepID=A0A0B7A1B4_9EUPU